MTLSDLFDSRRRFNATAIVSYPNEAPAVRHHPRECKPIFFVKVTMSDSLLRKMCHLALLSATLVLGNCWAQEAAGVEHRMSMSVPHAGQGGHATFVWRNFPQTRLYPDFTAAEKKIFHTWYEDIAAGDEPPYPTVNMETLSRRFGEMLQRYPVSGNVKLLLQINADGTVKSFSILGSSSPAVTELNMLILRDVRFKPAKCGGKPCAMDFPWFYSIAMGAS